MKESKLSSPARIKSGQFAPFDSYQLMTNNNSRFSEYQYNYGGNNASFQVPAQSVVSKSRQPTIFDVSVVDSISRSTAITTSHQTATS